MKQSIRCFGMNGKMICVYREIESINDILPNVDDGRKAIALRMWIRLVLSKIIDYKAQHRRLLNEAASRLQLVLPNHIVLNNVLPFVELPLHTFDREEEDGTGVLWGGEEEGVRIG